MADASPCWISPCSIELLGAKLEYRSGVLITFKKVFEKLFYRFRSRGVGYGSIPGIGETP